MHKKVIKASLTQSVFTMCNGNANPSHWTEQWRHDQVCRHPPSNKTEFINFSEKDLITDDSSFCAYSFSSWCAVSCLPFVYCPSLSVNSIFDDVISSNVISTMLKFWTKFSNVLIRWFVPKITNLWLNLSKLCLEYYWLLFFPGHGIYMVVILVHDRNSVSNIISYVLVSSACRLLEDISVWWIIMCCHSQMSYDGRFLRVCFEWLVTTF